MALTEKEKSLVECMLIQSDEITELKEAIESILYLVEYSEPKRYEELKELIE